MPDPGLKTKGMLAAEEVLGVDICKWLHEHRVNEEMSFETIGAELATLGISWNGKPYGRVTLGNWCRACEIVTEQTHKARGVIAGQ